MSEGRLRVWHWVAIAIVAVLIAISLSVQWMLNTESGARWVANRAVGLLAGKLQIREVHGAISGPLTVNGVRYRDAESGVDVQVERASVDIAMSELFSWRVHVLFVDVGGVNVRLFEHPPKEEEPSHFSLQTPIDMVLDRLTLKDARVTRDDKELVVVRTADAAASWTHAGVAIQKLVVDSPDGNVHLTGDVADHGAYVGRANGGFRWKVGDLEYAGDLTATSRTAGERRISSAGEPTPDTQVARPAASNSIARADAELTVQLRLTAPFGAHLDATLGETKALPWTFALSVPTFDPRENVLRNGSLESLAATLRGRGDLTVAEVNGDATLNGQRLRIEPLRVRLNDQVVNLEALTLIDPSGRGTVSAQGVVRLGAAASAGERNVPTPAAPGGTAGGEPAPLFADLNVQWKGVELPKEWVGQPLASHGALAVKGTPATFTAGGTLALGPPGHLADIAIDINGTPGQIQFKKLDIMERTGELRATGVVRLKPAIGWQFNATASRFDPGEFVVGWSGQLGFALDTKGDITPQGPNAELDLQNLQGTLRGRSLAGRADLTMNPSKVISGDLELRSGKSRLALKGRGGKTMDVETSFDIASLDDWLPKAAGRFNGRFHITGVWPKLAIEGGAQGRELAYTEYSVKAIDIAAEVRNPQAPAGSLKIKTTDIVAAGFTFSNTDLTLSGDEKDHTLQLNATGQPLTVQTRIHGARAGPDGWAGTVDQLLIAAAGLEPLSLRSPAQVKWSPRGFDVSESCLTGEHISACAAASQNEAGELNAKYRLEHLPLGLIAALAAPQMPLRIEAVIEGDGNLQRKPNGALFGEAHISSASGRITDAAAAAQEDAADALLTYENLKLDAQLAGDTAQGTLRSALGGSGSLEGQIMLANLQGSSPSLDGHAKLSIADLSPAGLFVPQLADVHGRGDANLDFAGTVADPQITGSVTLRELAAEVPQVGIKLHDGELQGSMTPDKALRVTGKVSSGDGQIALHGEGSIDGVLNVKIQGKDFVAANIPGAKVFIEPDLSFERNAEKMRLTGTVTVPRADVDIPKLPKQGNAQSASADVVVIDDESEAVAKSKSVPLEADVNLVLGQNVSLIGYGLNAKVAGQIAVHEVQNEATTASGELRVSGTYKAYGQDLTIEQGRILYAGQAINDPQVNIIAKRTVDTVTAKLTVSGSAQRPLLEVSSDPPLPQTQALSYLVTGKPLNEVGSREGDMVQSAARSLGGAAGNLLAKGVGKRFGISEIGVEDSPEIGGSAFTVGQYLSPRLYLSYGVGLFEPGQVVTLRYRISKKLSLEAVQGTLNQKAGISYRVEK